MRDVADTLERLGLRWYLTGSEALAAYGAPRQTLDTDIVLDTIRERLADVADALDDDHYFAEPLRIERRWMASLIDRSGSGKVDLIIRDSDGWGDEAMLRRQRWAHPIWVPCGSRRWRISCWPSSSGRKGSPSCSCAIAGCSSA